MSVSVFQGSCLCGTVSYEITGTPFDFFHCHCQRCRKANGTGHAEQYPPEARQCKVDFRRNRTR